VVFSGRRKTGHLDLEAVEMAVRAAMHRAGSAAFKAAFGGADSKVKGIGIVWDTVIRSRTDTDGLVSAGRNVSWLNTTIL
jgi:hypothetical protein